MRIISPFRDYYDGVQGQGFDDRIIYERRTEETDIRSGMSVGDHGPRWTREAGWGDTRQPQADQSLLPAFHHHRPRLFTGNGQWSSYQSPCIDGMLYLAGRAFPFWQTPPRAPALRSFEPTFVEDARQKLNVSSWEREVIDPTPWQGWLADHWGREIDPAVHFHHRSPIVLYLGERRIVNPCLRDYQFQKALDAYTVFQEVEMFLGGVMAEAREPPSPQSDKERIASHGMDVKRSFRNMPRG